MRVAAQKFHRFKALCEIYSSTDATDYGILVQVIASKANAQTPVYQVDEYRGQ